MSFIPDVRSKEIEPLYQNTHGANNSPKENAYWEGYLPEDQSIAITGYDDAVEAVDNLFYSLEPFADVFEAMGIDIYRFYDFIGQNNGLWEDLDITSIDEFDQAVLGRDLCIILGFRQVLLQALEMERNEIVVSMLDGVGEEEYESTKNRVDNQGYKNAILRMKEFRKSADKGFPFNKA